MKRCSTCSARGAVESSLTVHPVCPTCFHVLERLAGLKLQQVEPETVTVLSDHAARHVRPTPSVLAGSARRSSMSLARRPRLRIA